MHERRPDENTNERMADRRRPLPEADLVIGAVDDIAPEPAEAPALDDVGGPG